MLATEEETPTTKVRFISLIDRCDRCGADAKRRYTKNVGGEDKELRFCFHHSTQHADALFLDRWESEVIG